MSAAGAPAAPRPLPATRLPGLAARRLLRLELRRNAMLWMVPLAAALFWYQAYRKSMAGPPLWNLRAMTMQNDSLLDFVLPVVGGAAWMGSREGRRHTTDLLAGTAWPRWARQLTTWAATTCWAMVAYLGCVGVLYTVTAQQAAWGGPLWWPAAVGAAGVPLLTALGFAAGALFPSRFTMPLVTVAVFFALGFGSQAAHGGTSYWQIMPVIAGAVDIGADSGVGTFYHYLPDLSIAQVMFLAGFTVAVLGVLGLPAGSGGRRLRGSAAAITVAGLAVAGTAVTLAGTARLDAHGMMTIPALHDAASDRPIRYTPVCSHSPIPVCLNPAYPAYLPAVTAALEPVLSEVAGLPGAPVRVSQTALTYRQESGNGIGIGRPGLAVSGRPPVFHLVLPDQPGGLTVTTTELAGQVRSMAVPLIVDAVVYGSGGRKSAVVRPERASPHVQAQQALAAVAAALVKAAGVRLPGPVAPRVPRPGNSVPGPTPGSPAYAAAMRFAALPAAARHAWLAEHLAALRAGHITLAQLP